MTQLKAQEIKDRNELPKDSELAGFHYFFGKKEITIPLYKKISHVVFINKKNIYALKCKDSISDFFDEILKETKKKRGSASYPSSKKRGKK